MKTTKHEDKEEPVSPMLTVWKLCHFQFAGKRQIVCNIQTFLAKLFTFFCFVENGAKGHTSLYSEKEPNTFRTYGPLHWFFLPGMPFLCMTGLFKSLRPQLKSYLLIGVLRHPLVFCEALGWSTYLFSLTKLSALFPSTLL